MNTTYETDKYVGQGTDTIDTQNIKDLSFTEIIKKFIKIITFVDLPIKRKFMLFSFGVLFWFIVMFIVSIMANIYINNKTNKIIDYIVPLDKVTQKILLRVQALNDNLRIIEGLHTTDKQHHDAIRLTKENLKDLRSFIMAMKHGGQIIDIDREENQLRESFTIKSLIDIMEVKVFITNMIPVIDKLQKNFEIIERNLNSSNINSPKLKKAITEYRKSLNKVVNLINEYSPRFSRLYAISSSEIGKITKLTIILYIGILLIATSLLFLFTVTISRSIVIPVNSIIDQIKSLATGKVDLSKKIKIHSKDEIGTLTEDFNTLTREIYDIVTFKKVIEEDDSVEDVYTRLGKAFKEKCGLEDLVIYEVSNTKNKMRPVYPVMIDEKALYCSQDILDNCDLCKVKKTGHSISSASYPEICKQFNPEVNKIHLCIPMVIGGRTGGVVQFLFKDKEEMQSKAQMLFKAEQYIKESLSVIEAKRLMDTLRESALKDPLTGLYNRRFLQEYTETLVASTLRRKKNLGLIMCDLDFFKQVNDYYGHNAGDAVLKETSELIRKTVRTSDLVIRFGGEEFLVVLLDIEEGDAMGVAEKIRETIEKTKIIA